ncbi:H/ACA ribonucleoprotein complex subunit 2-like protein [Anabrus simplex]|uniref:H/ACA ribonucleoprotein complex subunit 2-like protein n=1 Tax=Anabrus simplex TaxID=316456 RepID=UPI0035A2E950
MGKKSKEDDAECPNTGDVKDEDMSYEEKVKFASVIAKPMASRKLAKRVYKVIKKASKHKTFLRNGLKDVQRRIRKGETGIVILAGDVTPIDIMCHIPAVCEDRNMPYVYTPSRQDLGAAMGVKRGSLMVLIREHEEYKDLYDKLHEELKLLPIPM